MPLKRRELVLTRSARADLGAVYDFIARDSPQSAQRYIQRLVSQMMRLAKLGVEGVSRDHIRPGLRMHPLGRYVCYFRLEASRLIVIRIVHGSRDRSKLDFDV